MQRALDPVDHGRGSSLVPLLPVAGLLLLTVAIRSFVGGGGTHALPAVNWLAVGIPLAAFTGKLAGGVLADRYGWIRTSVGALLLSLPLLVIGKHEPWLVVIGLALFQTTMPVTLSALGLLFPGRPATAFGLSCLALVIGALFGFLPVGRQLYLDRVFVALIVVSAVGVGFALQLLAVGGREKKTSVFTFHLRATFARSSVAKFSN